MTTDEQLTIRKRASRLRAAGLTSREISEVIGVSHQRVSQILADEPLIEWGQAVMWVDGPNSIVQVNADVDVRILHAALKQALKRIGVEVSDEKMPGYVPVGHPRWQMATDAEEESLS